MRIVAGANESGFWGRGRLIIVELSIRIVELSIRIVWLIPTWTGRTNVPVSAFLANDGLADITELASAIVAVAVVTATKQFVDPRAIWAFLKVLALN